MPSTQTRTKLKSFQFVEGTPAAAPTKDHEQEKENMPKPRKAEETPKMSRTVDVGDHNAADTPKMAQVKNFPPPSTPATRLPLADLVGNGNESSRHAVNPAVSPDEQLCWRGSQPVNTPQPRKGKKRARSSSPAAPSQEEQLIDVSGREMNTPLADPGKELWNRYANIKGTPTVNRGAAFAHLINEASPRSSAQAGSVSGLRRWASCGVEFPTSATKRRKTQGAFRGEARTKTEDVFGGGPSSDGMIQAQPPHSKRASIVRRLIEASEASRPAPRDPAHLVPSSSSPLPEAGDRTVPTSACESPLQRHTRLQQIPEGSDSVQDAEMEVIEEDDSLPETGRPSDSSDEFNDPDFDSVMVESLTIDRANDIQDEVHADNDVVEAVPGPLAADEVVLDNVPKADSDDEFGLDEDLFAADMELVASLYDTRAEGSSEGTLDHPEAGPKPVDSLNHPAAPVIHLIDEDSDDFGDDDIGADDLVAAEFAATQAHASNSTGH
ncbi:hypothetical protein P154DRAFT_105023 [Amniculicola lignicola CBS 123094]|uniref:Uncharacterized protein n=1 Tax=Amniculicola lignicola CBS 123094 TaxID=1392246 RepID=A0A6A5WQM8_9PLEO|nr:hypothetical protein P154DRAFT_105023 [Amniculicola lignicola CBS 123094]